MRERVKNFFTEKTMIRIFHFMALVMFALLFHYCLELTGENSGSFRDEHIYFKQDSILWNVFRIFCAVIVLYFIGKLSVFLQPKKRRNILLAGSCILAAGLSFYWVMNSGTEPQADQAIVAGFADVFNEGDFYGIQKGGYIAVYPQQLGLVTFLRLLYRIFGAGNYYAFQLLVAAMVPVIVFSGCMVIRELSNDDAGTELFYLLFADTCFPMYAYSSFVYGDLISIPFLLLSIWAFLSCMRSFRIWKLVGMGLSIGLAVMFRVNIMIAVVAMLIVVMIKLFTKRDWHMLWIGVAIVVGVLSFHLSIKAIYASEWGEDAEAMPPLCFVAMGLNDDYSYPGWYNIYSLGLFATSDYDVDVANKRALETLAMYALIYKDDPEYMVDFFTRKMNAQWNAPLYQCIVMNNNVVGEQSELIADIFWGGRAARFLQSYAKLYQLLVYGGILFLLLVSWKDWKGIERYVLLIAVFGGFLFSLLWEAKTRYVFPYLLMELPYAAMGINEVIIRLNQRLKKRTIE